VQKYREGKMQRTLKRELKGPETDGKEALDTCIGSVDTSVIFIFVLEFYPEQLGGVASGCMGRDDWWFWRSKPTPLVSPAK